MIKLLPIIPDCLCVVIVGPAAGTELTVISKREEPFERCGVFYSDWWYIEPSWLAQGPNPIVRAVDIMRIGGRTKQTEKERSEVIT